MHCERHQFTGLTRDGGFAEYVLVDERSLVPLPAGASPSDVAPHADAGITAYHAVKKLVPRLGPGSTVAVDRRRRRRPHRAAASAGARRRRRDRGRHRRTSSAARCASSARDEVLGEQGDVVDAVREATNGAGADVVVDFVGTDETHAAEHARCWRGAASTRSSATEGRSPSRRSRWSPTRQAIAGNLVGSWIDLWELLQLHARGDVTLRTETHPLDVRERRARSRCARVTITGRAVLVPSGARGR